VSFLHTSYSMIKRFIPPAIQLLVSAAVVFPVISNAQCMSYPVALNERVARSGSLVFGKVTGQHCYEDAKGNIYTLNKIDVAAWLKNYKPETEVYVITIGGMLGNKAQLSYPAIQLDKGQEYFLMLEDDNAVMDDKNFRAAQPGKLQALPYADAQGAWRYQNSKYYDIYIEGALTESELMDKITFLTGEQVRKPDGTTYTARSFAARGNQTTDIATLSPNPTAAGTVNPIHYLIITGSGFGSTPGTVGFPNADNGGSTRINPPNASDYVTWTDNLIVVKVPTGSVNNAGSGQITVNSFTSFDALIVDYSHISINSNFSNFPSQTRQRYYLRNLDGLGGYTFQYNTNFDVNAAAKAAFERALTTWTCKSGINWRTSGTTTNGYADDATNVVLFDATLPSGVLARATSRFNGSAITGSCDMENTVWWLKEIDVQARESGVTWQYGPALATSGQYDFETVLLHELGHAHGLGHRIAFGQLMNWSVGSATNIRTPAAQEIEGAQYKMSYSTAPTCFNPAGSGTEMIAAGCPFPVKLIVFDGVMRRYGAELNWQTENELNTDKFEIQRSNSGIEFYSVGSVKAKGNSSALVSYQFADGTIKQGVNYYRLRMIDKDGKYEYSNIITLKAEFPVKAFAVISNPVKNELRIASSMKATLRLVDAGGRVVKRINIKEGVNTFDINNLSNGIYYLVDIDSGSKVKLVVIH
jgi:hypothetical protein